MDLTVVLVDDEQLARDELGYLLEQLGGVEVIGQAGNGVAALTTSERLQPDVVFPDIHMPGPTGFQAARRLLASRGPRRHLCASAAHHRDLPSSPPSRSPDRAARARPGATTSRITSC